MRRDQGVGITLEFRLPHQPIQAVIVSALNHRTDHHWAFLLPFLFLGVCVLHSEEWSFKNVNQITSLPCWKTSEGFHSHGPTWSCPPLRLHCLPLCSRHMDHSAQPLRCSAGSCCRAFTLVATWRSFPPAPPQPPDLSPDSPLWGGSPWPPKVMSSHPQHFQLNPFYFLFTHSQYLVLLSKNLTVGPSDSSWLFQIIFLKEYCIFFYLKKCNCIFLFKKIIYVFGCSGS